MHQTAARDAADYCGLVTLSNISLVFSHPVVIDHVIRERVKYKLSMITRLCLKVEPLYIWQLTVFESLRLSEGSIYVPLPVISFIPTEFLWTSSLLCCRADDVELAA